MFKQLVDLVILVFIFTCLSHSGLAQNSLAPGTVSGMNIPHIKLVKQWPPQMDKPTGHTFSSRFQSLFLGKKTPTPVRPVSMVASDSGNFWILDQGIRSVFHVNGQVGDIPHFLLKKDFKLSSLVAMCLMPSDEFLFTDSGSDRVFKVIPGKKSIQTLIDSAVLDHPTGIAYSSVSDEIWVVETNAHHISVFSQDGVLKKQIGSRGTARGEFNYPTHIWIDRTGLIYVVDAMNYRVQVLDATGEVVSVFGQQGDASGYFARPKGIATDSRRNIYIVDGLFHVVQVFDLKGNYLFAIGQQGAGKGEFWMPNGIFIDDRDFIYVADSYNSRIQVFQTLYGP